jgi:hypothetical protein
MTDLTTMIRLTRLAAAPGLLMLILCSCGSSAHSAAATQDTCQRVSAGATS